MATQPRPDSPQVRRKSWPAVPRSILKKRPNLSVEDTESGIGPSVNSEQNTGEVKKEPNVIEVVQDEANSVNSSATVVSARTARKRRIAGIFQHYYPEGGWGYVVLLCAFLSQVLAQGLQLGMLVLMPYAARRFHASPAEVGKNFHRKYRYR